MRTSISQHLLRKVTGLSLDMLLRTQATICDNLSWEIFSIWPLLGSRYFFLRRRAPIDATWVKTMIPKSFYLYVGVFVGHWGEEGIDSGFEAVDGNLVDEALGLNTTLVVVGEEDLDNWVELEVHQLKLYLAVKYYSHIRSVGVLKKMIK